MPRFRDTTYKYILLLGAVLFLFATGKSQACLLADHDCSSPVPMNVAEQVDVGCHAPSPWPMSAPQNAGHELSSSHHSQQQPNHECCQLIPADLGGNGQIAISTNSHQQSSSDWFNLQLANSFLYSSYPIQFAQREIASPPWQDNAAVSSSLVFPLYSGRAPPPTV